MLQPARAAASTQPWSTRMPLRARAACMLRLCAFTRRAFMGAAGLDLDYFMSAAIVRDVCGSTVRSRGR